MPSVTIKFAFICFYSKNAGRAAKVDLDGKEFMGKIIKIKLSKEKTEKYMPKVKELRSENCIQIANFYIGFNKWSSSIVGMNRESIETNEGRFVCTYTCTVKIVLTEDDRFTIGTGKGIASELTRELSVENAQKKAVTNARKHAFQNLVVILLPSENGLKVAVHIINQPLPDSLKTKDQKEKNISYSKSFDDMSKN
eukprot:TRINITY_DN1162_c0_g1_i3.p1 TRINITY_DN1162_c0_g1~~TRINITY_DN1162_c0_g1_i3.p1  ORF type:complete len:196 (-),score=33.73 TRINITY_DN1162_c0_g1_i3:100-687(-)